VSGVVVQMNAMYEYVLAKRRAMEAQARALEEGMNVKPKYEYDSDEDTEGGTWEHKRRVLEMEATKGCSIQYRISSISSISSDARLIRTRSVSEKIIIIF